MGTPRNTRRYTMRTGNRIQKFGITSQTPEQRESQNRNDGTPGKMRIEGPAVTRDSALKWERSKVENYRKRNGRMPPPNKV